MEKEIENKCEKIFALVEMSEEMQGLIKETLKNLYLKGKRDGIKEVREMIGKIC